MTPERSVARRVAIGTGANVLGQAAAVLVNLALVPIILHAVGPTDYGIWIVVGSIASIGFMLDAGMSSGLVKFVAEHAARSEVGQAARMIGAATSLYALLGGLLVVIGVAIALTVPGRLGFHGAAARLAEPLIILAALDVGISLPAIAPIAVLRGLQRFPMVNAILGGGAVLGGLLSFVAINLGTGVIGVSAVGALNSMITYTVSVVGLQRVAPEYMAVPLTWDAGRARQLLTFSRSIAITQVAGRMQTRLDAVIIAAALPVRMVTPYNFAQRLADGTRIATDQFTKILLPLATEMGATRDEASVRRLFLTSTRLALAIALAVGLPLVFLGGSILDIWVGDAFSGYGPLVALLALAAIVDLASYPAAAVLQSMERHGPLAWVALGSGFANVGLSIALVGPYGIEGVAAATLIASGAEIAIFVLPYSARVLGVSLPELAFEVGLRLVLPSATLIGVLLTGAAILNVRSLLPLAIVVGAALVAYALAYATVGAAAHERVAYRRAAAASRRLPAELRARRARRAQSPSSSERLASWDRDGDP